MLVRVPGLILTGRARMSQKASVNLLLSLIMYGIHLLRRTTLPPFVSWLPYGSVRSSYSMPRMDGSVPSLDSCFREYQEPGTTLIIFCSSERLIQSWIIGNVRSLLTVCRSIPPLQSIPPLSTLFEALGS